MEKVEVFVRIIDISQEILSCSIYPGDPAPKAEKLKSMEQGEKYNLSVFSMCAHNGTHIDAPSHFIKDGKSIEKEDKERANYYHTFTGKKWDDMKEYDFVLNTSKLSDEQIRDVVFGYIEAYFPELKK